MFIDREPERIPHSFRSAMCRCNYNSQSGVARESKPSREHCTPKGVRGFFLIRDL